jgi:hypothetical protein
MEMHTVAICPQTGKLYPLVLLWGRGIVSVDPGVTGDLGQLLELDSPSRSEGKEPIFLGVGVCGSMRFSKRYSGIPCCPRSIGTTWDIDGREFGDSAVHKGAEFLITLTYYVLGFVP